MPLRLFRTSIQRSEAGVLKILANASCTIYKTMAGDVAPIDSAGVVNVAATKATIYSDRNGTTQKSNPVTSDIQGYIEFYSDQSEFHILVVLVDGTRFGLLWVTHDGGQGAKISVLNYPTVADAIAATPVGGILYFPLKGGPYIAPSAGWVIDKSITIEGDKESQESTALMFATAAGGHKDDVIFKITGTAANWVKFKNLILTSQGGAPSVAGTGDAIRLDEEVTITQLSFENVTIQYAGRSGIRLQPDPNFSGDNYVVSLTMRNVRIYRCYGDGLYINQCTATVLDQVYSSLCKGSGIVIEGCAGIACSGLTAEANCDDLVDTWRAQVIFTNSSGASLNGGHIEAFNSVITKRGITFNGCKGGHISGLTFGGADIAGLNSIYLFNGTSGFEVGSCFHSQVDITVEIQDDASNSGNVIYPQGVVNATTNAPGRVIAPANRRNFVFIQDRTQATGLANNKGVGIALPELAGTGTGEAGSTILRNGLLAYDTTNGKLVFYHGGQWRTVTSTP